MSRHWNKILIGVLLAHVLLLRFAYVAFGVPKAPPQATFTYNHLDTDLQHGGGEFKSSDERLDLLPHHAPTDEAEILPLLLKSGYGNRRSQ